MSRLEVVEDTDTPEGRLMKVLERADDWDTIVVIAVDKSGEPWLYHSETRRGALCWMSMLFQQYVLDKI